MIMFWRFGRFFRTINYQIEEEIRETIYRNEYFKKYKWKPIEKIVIYLSRKPFKHALFIPFLLIISCIIINIDYSNVSNLLLIFFQSWNNNTDYKQIVLTNQLVLIGLIFPLVIGFVGLLLQGRTANVALWRIYRSYSGVLFTGLSGILLCITIFLTYLLNPCFNESTKIISTLLFIVWIVFNLTLSAWFIWTTFNFIPSDRLSKLILRYTINEALIDSSRTRIGLIILYKHLKEIFPSNTSEAEVRLFHIPSDESYKYEITLKVDKYVSNIRLFFLDFAIKGWRYHTRKLFITTNKQRPILQLPLRINQRQTNRCLIASSQYVPLSWHLKVLLRLSYSFINKKRYSDETEDIISALLNNVDDALREKNHRLFEASIDEIRQWQVDVTDSMAFINDEGEQDNYFLMPDSELFPRTFLDNLLSEYFQTANATIKAIPDSLEYFQTMCYFYPNLYNHAKHELANRISMKYVRAHSNIWGSLLKWQKSFLSGSSDNTTSIYINKPIMYFVGSWEVWLNIISINDSNYSRNTHHCLNHLHYTCRLLISGIYYTNWFACEWATDMLIFWPEKLYSSMDILYSVQHLMKTETLVPCVLNNEDYSDHYNYILNGQSDDESNRLVAHRMAMINSWLDARVVVAMYIMSKPDYVTNEKLKEIKDALLKCKRYFPSGGLSPSYASTQSGADILSLYIRHRWHWGNQRNSHSFWIKEILSSFGSIEQPDYVSGRIYSGWGVDDVKYLVNYYIITAIGLSRTRWELSRNWADFIFSDNLTHQDREQIISDLHDWENINDEMVLKIKQEYGESDYEKLIKNYQLSIEKAINTIRENQVNKVVSAKIDKTLLQAISRTSSRKVFPDIHKIMPLCLFEKVDFKDDFPDESVHTLNIKNFLKSDIAEGLTKRMTLNESDYFARMLNENISINAYRQIGQNIDFIDYIDSDIPAIIEKIVIDSNSLSQMQAFTPILLIGPWEIYDFLESAIWDSTSDRAKRPYDITRKDGFPKTYHCHVNNIEVYKTPFTNMNFCLLVPKEAFDSVEFKKYDKEIYITTNYTQNSEDPLHGELSIQYGLKCTFNPFKGIKYIYKQE